MYKVIKHYAGQPNPLGVQVSFELAYPDWCKFEKSDEWIRLAEALEDFQTERGSSQRQGKTAERVMP